MGSSTSKPKSKQQHTNSVMRMESADIYATLDLKGLKGGGTGATSSPIASTSARVNWEKLARDFDKKQGDWLKLVNHKHGDAQHLRDETQQYTAVVDQCTAMAARQTKRATRCQALAEHFQARADTSARSATREQGYVSGWQAEADECQTLAAQCRSMGRMAAGEDSDE